MTADHHTISDEPDTGASPYPPFHPWYYVLGGAVLSPRQICANARAAGYLGYRDDIGKAERASEPRRTAQLRAIRADVVNELRRDLARYRECVRNLAQYRRAANPRECEGVHVAISLKHNHLYNDFAHLRRIDDALSRQRDLFGG